MVGNAAGKGNVAVVTQKEDQSEMVIAIYTFCEEYVPTHIIKRDLQFIDIVMIKTATIVLAVRDLRTFEDLIFMFNSKTVSVTELDRKVKRLVSQDQKVYVIFENGGIFFLDPEKTIYK